MTESPMLSSLPAAYRAIVIGATGGIGAAFHRALAADPACAVVWSLHRQSEPAVDVTVEASVEEAARQARAALGGAELIIDASGILEVDGKPPEKTIARLDPVAMAQSFAVNAIGPALLLKHFAPLLPRSERSIFATLSARVGSIADNRRGGWISYRSAKAALNQTVRTSAIEIGFRHPRALVVGLQPGTVATPLSAPFVAADATITPDTSAHRLLAVLDATDSDMSGALMDHAGAVIAP